MMRELMIHQQICPAASGRLPAPLPALKPHLPRGCEGKGAAKEETW